MIPFAGTLAKSLAKRVGKATGKAGESSGILASFLSEILKASKMIRIYQKEQEENKKANEVINDLVEKSSYKLIETLGIEIAKICLSDQKVINAKVKIDKPGALRLSKNVGVIISRSKNEN